MGLGVEVDDSDRYDPLSEVLWCERGLLARLVFKLAVVRILLVAESYRWLPNAADEAAGIADELESVSGIRRALIRQQEASATLLDIAEGAPPPWDEILHDHREMLLVLRDRARRGASSTAAALAAAVDSLDSQIRGLERQGELLDSHILRLAWDHVGDVTGRTACSVPDDYGR